MVKASSNRSYAWQAPKVMLGFEPSIQGGSIASKLARAVSRAMKESTLSREEIASGMGEYLGYPIKLATLEAYASEAKETHCITVERLCALIDVTGCYDLLGFVAELMGHRVIPEHYANIIELHLIEEHERALNKRKQDLKGALTLNARGERL